MLEALGQVLPRAAERWGDEIALVFGDRRMSFRELDELSNRLASALGARGIAPGDRVTLYSGNRWEWIVSYYGVLKAGAVINPINVMLTPDEVRFVVRDCGAKAILASPDKGAPVADIGSDTDVSHVVCFGPDVPDGTVAFDALLGEGTPRFDVAPVAPDEMSTIGVALPFCEARVADLEDPSKTMPAGERGELIDDLPKTSTGKILRRELRET